MRTRSAVVALALALALLAPLVAGSAGEPALASTRALLRALRSTGRAEASVRLVRRDALSGRTIVSRGRLALELPRFARLDFENGERLTLREDGGEWLQPAVRQLVRARSRTAGGALAWWSAVLDSRGGGIRERRLAPRRYELELRAGGWSDRQCVDLAADGLPRRLVLAAGTPDSLEYRLTGWRFTRSRGRAGFVLEPPAGYDVVDMP